MIALYNLIMLVLYHLLRMIYASLKTKCFLIHLIWILYLVNFYQTEKTSEVTY